MSFKYLSVNCCETICSNLFEGVHDEQITVFQLYRNLYPRN